jgi:hypothetical protein
MAFLVKKQAKTGCLGWPLAIFQGFYIWFFLRIFGLPRLKPGGGCLFDPPKTPVFERLFQGSIDHLNMDCLTGLF